MKFLMAFTIIFLALMPSCLASGEEPEAFFTAPSYIEPDYYNIIGGYDSPVVITSLDKLLTDMIGNKEQFGTIYPRGISTRPADELMKSGLPADYMKAAADFNTGNFLQATATFNRIVQLSREMNNDKATQDATSWAYETSLYMIGRCHLVNAQTDWDGYSDPLQSVDQEQVKQAEEAFNQYLNEYPSGLYVNSSVNLRRKIFRLSGRNEELNQEYKNAFAREFSRQHDNVDDKQRAWQLVIEFNNMFEGSVDIIKDPPIIVAYGLLHDAVEKEDVVRLQNRKSEFDSTPGLYRYLLALALYKTDQYNELLETVFESEVDDTVLSRSTELLRARAFERMGKFDQALSALTKINAAKTEQSIELEFSVNKAKLGHAPDIYKSNSIVKSENVLSAVAQVILTDLELRHLLAGHDLSPEKRPIIVQELAKRYLLSMEFHKLADLFRKEKDLGRFADFHSLSMMLEKNPDDVAALVDTGEMIYQKGINPDNQQSSFVKYPPFKEMELRFDKFPEFLARRKTYKSPWHFFKKASNLQKRAGSLSDAEARALHYIAKCFRPYDAFDRCLWQDSSVKSNAKLAFRRLHRFYKKNGWTEKTQYYY